MKGQLIFDEFMNISEELPKKEEFVRRTPMADPCYYCLCNSCVNNAENMTVSPDEVPDDWNPCFFCDDCRRFDEKCSKDMEREQCDRYVVDNYHAEQNRKRFKIVR